MLNTPLIIRLYNKILRQPNGCWEWSGYCDPQYGYGRLRVKSLNEQLVHRVSYIVHKGDIPKDICVLHKCDNPPCVNPDHLFLGTRDDNNKDRASKGRTITPNMNLTHCKRGHEFDEENTYVRKTGKRMCRKCNNKETLRRYHESSKGLRPKIKNYKTHCSKGHAYNLDNASYLPSGKIYCNQCNRDRARVRRQSNGTT